MAGRLEDEEYWNSSERKGFNFEDDEFGSQLCGVSKSGTAKLCQQVRGLGGDNAHLSTNSLSGSISKTTLSERPLHTLISEKSLLCILEAGNFHEKQPKGKLTPEEEVRILRRQLESRWVPPPVKETATKILLGHPYSLELYRTLESKTELLDAAISMGDGNAILAVLLFLVRTLKKNLVHQLLQSRPEAVTQYCQYLSTRMQLHELTDLLEMLGDSREASMKQFQLSICGTVDLQRRLQKLRTCLNNHFSQPDNRDRPLMEGYIRLLEWQLEVAESNPKIAKDLVGQSVLTSLAYTCSDHWGEPKGMLTSPHTLCQQQGISDRQFQWTVLTVRASTRSWDDIEGLFITKSWLGGKRVKTAVPMEQVVMQLHSHGAPPDILAKYLDLIDNVEKRLTLAKKLQCHKAVINIYVSKRDRQSLISYKATLHTQSEDFFYAENCLRVSTTKWRN